jgi:DNA-directed RNA polymerase specialized sigma subunit
MTAKEYLRQAWHLDTKIDMKLEQVAALHELAKKATSTLSDMPGAPTRNTHKMEDIIIKIMMLENEVNDDIDMLVDLKDEIMGVIGAVDEEECRLVLEKRYLCYETWEEIALDMHCGLRTIYRIHGEALKKIAVP